MPKSLLNSSAQILLEEVHDALPGQVRRRLVDIESTLRAGLATLRGVSADSIWSQTREWWHEEVRPFVARGARAVLERHRTAGDRLVLLTSSSKYAAEMAREEFRLDAVLFQGYGEGEVVGGQVEDHTSVPEPNTHLCGVKVEGSSFEGVVPLQGVTRNSVWVKASGDICCIAGFCPEEGPPSCA